MVATINRYRQNKVEQNRAFALLIRHLKAHNLVRIAADPNRISANDNERIIAAAALDELEKNHRTEPISEMSSDDIQLLLDLVRDKENNRSITGDELDRNKKENNALLRGEAAIALAEYGVKTPEFILALTRVLLLMEEEPLFVPRNGNGSVYHSLFACALDLAQKK